jgi:type I restriction enzyme, S subunit
VSVRTVQLEVVCDVTDGTHYTPLNSGGPFPFLTVKDMTEDGLAFKGCSYVEEFEFSKARNAGACPSVGDVLFSKDGTVGKVHVVSSERPFAVLSSIAILRPDRARVNSSFLGYALRNPAILRDATNRKTGSALQRIILADLKEVSIPLPSLSEQKYIARLMGQADRLRRTRRYALELSDNFLPAAFVALFGDPDKNPKKTRLVAAGELFDIQLGKMLDAKRYTGKFLKPYLGNANVQWGRFALDDLKEMDFPGDDFERFKLKRGDILVCEGGEVGRTAIWQGGVADCCYQKALHRLRRTREHILPEYFLHYMRAAAACGLVARHSSTATIGHFSKETFEEFPVMLPPFALQAHFAGLVQRHERLQARQCESLRQAGHLFQSLLDRAFR